MNLKKTKIDNNIEYWERKADKLNIIIFIVIMIGIYGGIVLGLYLLEKSRKPVLPRETPKASPTADFSPTERPSSYVFPPIDTLPYVTNDKHFYAVTTAYSKKETCPNRNCVTASGRTAVKGITAACPRSIMLGKYFQISTGQSYRCDDRTNRRYDGRFDLYIGEDETAYQEAIKYGIQVKKITVLQ